MTSYGWQGGTRCGPMRAWGERATALAEHGGLEGFWGDLPATLVAARPRAPHGLSWATDDCPVCYEAYSDAWPSPDPLARAPVGRWTCRAHAICRGCDYAVQQSANDKCPLCRAARREVLVP